MFQSLIFIVIALAYFFKSLILYKRSAPNILKNLIENKQIKPYHIDSQKNSTNILTKILIMLQQPLVTMTNSNIINKSLSRILSGDHKRTQQGVSARLLPYLYKLQVVHANTNSPCSKVYILSISTLYIYHEINMLLTYSLTSFIQSTLVCSRPMTSHHVICHVTTVTCLFIVNKKKKKKI